MKKEEMNHAEQNTKGWLETIIEQVDALEMDWKRYEELKGMSIEDMSAEEKVELAELVETATIEEEIYENPDDVRERIEECPLSVQVRSGWYAPGAEGDAVKPEEFEILLSTGGPALRIIGDLDGYGRPALPRLQHQDWGTPWIEYFTVDQDALEKWCACFYFGD